MAKKKWYVVWSGREPGIFTNWDDCKRSTEGYPEAKFKAFASEQEAYAAYNQNASKYISRKGISKPSIPKVERLGKGLPIADSIAVDAACSGNPGRMEYRGVDTVTGESIFHAGPYSEGTNNIGEFLAIVHALALLQSQQNPTKIIYTDSKIAMGWVKAKKCNTNLKLNSKNIKLFEHIKRAENWLVMNNYFNPILKWETRIWGEIPADFGRK